MLLKKFFEKNPKIFGVFFKRQYCPAKRGKHHQLSTRKEVRMWNLIAGSFTNSVLFRSFVIRYCTMKLATPIENFADTRQRK